MKFLLSLLLLQGSLFAIAQQQVEIIGRCGGMDTVLIPSITDNDEDGMDDLLEEKLMKHFMPVFIQFNDESCPGPALDGTGDSNIVVCRVYPYPAQYVADNNAASVITHPVTLVPAQGLTAGLVWHNPLVMVRAALLYGKDCGITNHTADVEGFSFSLRYIGADLLAGWMYDTTMANWKADIIQTVSHEGTVCEKIETLPYASIGRDTIYASPDKHGNYLTISKCNSSFICDPPCNGTPSAKTIKPVNIGEPNHTFVGDLGSVYAAYAGNDPWSSANFLAAQNGSAGPIGDKLILPLTADFTQGQTLNTAQIAALYSQCYTSTGFNYLSNKETSTPVIYPNPAHGNLQLFAAADNPLQSVTVYNAGGKQVKRIAVQSLFSLIDISDLQNGFYIVELVSEEQVNYRKLFVE